VAPSQSLLDEIQNKKAEIIGLNDSLKRIKQELDSEHNSIETDRRSLSGRPQDQHDLSIRIKAYNEKINWHNQRVADMKAKELVLKSMISEYNAILQTYNNCRASH
jgi:lipid II:glycine glycyltransferase (peptidoglycan interpeptide bridge formation enzyme)